MASELVVNILTVIGAFTVIFLIFKLILSFKVFSYYITAKFAESPIPLMDLIFMKIRKVNLEAVVNSYIMLSKSEVKIKLTDLETADLAGQDLSNITSGLITAKKKGILMTIQQAMEADKKNLNIVSEINKRL